MKVIIRFSLNRDHGSKLRNKLKATLEAGGIEWDASTTATYRNDNISSTILSDTLQQFWLDVNAHCGKAKFDHFWMYCDNPPPIAGLPADLAMLADLDA